MESSERACAWEEKRADVNGAFLFSWVALRGGKGERKAPLLQNWKLKTPGAEDR